MKATVTLNGELGWVREGQKRDCISVTADVEVTTNVFCRPLIGRKNPTVNGNV
jgi:hypothetical protein